MPAVFSNKDHIAKSLELPKNLSDYGSGFNRSVDLRLNRLGMGYLKKDDLSPHAPVSWVEKENSFVHPFSLKKRAFDYGFHQIKDVMPLDVYLDMPVDILDDIIEGIREGAEERMKQTPKTPEDKNRDPLLEYLSGQLNKS